MASSLNLSPASSLKLSPRPSSKFPPIPSFKLSPGSNLKLSPGSNLKLSLKPECLPRSYLKPCPPIGHLIKLYLPRSPQKPYQIRRIKPYQMRRTKPYLITEYLNRKTHRH
jgi:hypothetical protein